MDLLEYKKNKYKLTNDQGELLKKIENKLDAMFKNLNIDINFSRHFKERFVQRKILPDEIIDTFKKLYKKYNKKIVRDDYDALIHDIFTYLNIPIAIEWSEKDNEFDLTSITVFKQKDYSDPKRDRLDV